MVEELNENDLEDRMYAMLHHVDESQSDVMEHSQSNGAAGIVKSTPTSTVRRYWRTSWRHDWRAPAPVPVTANPSPFVNTPPIATKSRAKEALNNHAAEPVNTLFQSNPSKNLKTSIEFLDNDSEDQVLELVTSDEDEVIEIALPPKPTITIESSDEEVEVEQKCEPSPPKKPCTTSLDKRHNGEREVSASPVPSVVSSVSDEFIRGDCIALNISSKRSNNHSFDFSLHGADFVVQDTPSKKKKRKKNKEDTSVIITSTPDKTTELNQREECFATPRSKSSKKQKSKSNYAQGMQENSVPQMDIYDSDSNQSIDTNKKQTSYVVSDKSFPSIDVYESDSSQPDSVANVPQQITNNHEIKSSESSDSDLSKTVNDLPKSSRQRTIEQDFNSSTIDLSDNLETSENLTTDKSIEENFVMANVTGFDDCSVEIDINQTDSDPGQFGSTKIPAILNEDLDFDNLKGLDRSCNKRKFSVATLRAEMEKFYNESWGGENFNHREIQKRMSKDKSLWQIDPRDRMPMMAMRKRPVCESCGRGGHVSERCHWRTPVCHMCGVSGHRAPRCPGRMCTTCGAPQPLYSAVCRACRAWRQARCALCRQRGHPRRACPDLWRRYHNTTDVSAPLERCSALRSPASLYCSGCARRGHLVHDCRLALPFSAAVLTSPAVADYTPLYGPPAAPPAPVLSPSQPVPAPQPAAAAAPAAKRRYTSVCETAEGVDDRSPRTLSEGKEADDDGSGEPAEPDSSCSPEPAGNRDKCGRMIQDNSVSATSDVVTAAQLFVPDELAAALREPAGRAWLPAAAARAQVIVAPANAAPALLVTGTPPQQEAFQAEMRQWAHAGRGDAETEPAAVEENAPDIPRNRFNVIRKLSKALDSLEDEADEPRDIYKEMVYQQRLREKLLRARNVSAERLATNRRRLAGARASLNAALLGRAGLAGGARHVRCLRELAARLGAARGRLVPDAVRAELHEHFSPVFTPQPRDDYAALLRHYYGAASPTPPAPGLPATQTPPAHKPKKKKKKSKKPKKVPVVAQEIISSVVRSSSKDPVEATERASNVLKSFSKDSAPDTSEPPPTAETPSGPAPSAERSPFSKSTLQKLVIVQRRLQRTALADPILKKQRQHLVRVLTSQIASLNKSEKITSKTMKKMKKTQHEALTFLRSV